MISNAQPDEDLDGLQHKTAHPEPHSAAAHDDGKSIKVVISKLITLRSSLDSEREFSWPGEQGILLPSRKIEA
jgi:hypothetical protein